VVGAGPAGLVTAGVLARRGIEVLLLERRASGSELPRATVVSTRVMELLRSWGLAEEVLAGADDVVMALLEMPSAARADEGTLHEVGYPTPAQSAVVSPMAPACVAQDHLEAVLMRYVAALPSVTVRRGVEALSAAPDPAGATLDVRDLGASRRERLRAAYVVAADGARSALRASLGVEMTGPEAVMHNLRVEFRAPLWEVLGAHRYGVYTIDDPAAGGVLLPAGRGDRWLYGFELGGPGDEGAPDQEELRRRIVRASGVPGLPVHIERSGRYTAGAQVARTFSSGTVYLVGDAAHRVTPRGGTGLNTAVTDGFDLGWKLGWVVDGWAPASLLETYELERRPAVVHNVTRSIDPYGSRRAVLDELQVDLGGRIAHAWVQDEATGRPTSVSTHDLLGPGLTLFTAGHDDRWCTAASSRPLPVAVRALPAGTARSLGLQRPGGGLLVRPDGAPVATWAVTGDHSGELTRSIACYLGPVGHELAGSAA
jgi:2-polyprenyl-6-methoxyphenol hydroxylase-like FAD-dependent oxidoreductase